MLASIDLICLKGNEAGTLQSITTIVSIKFGKCGNIDCTFSRTIWASGEIHSPCCPLVDLVLSTWVAINRTGP